MLRVLAVAVGLLCAVSFTQASLPQIAGNEMHTDVSMHSKIDLDQKEMEAFLGEKPPNYVKAKAIYTSGKNSQKSSGMRTLKGFSDNNGKLSSEKYFKMYKTYWNKDAYADDLVVGALDGTGMYKGQPDAFRVEAAKKTSAYQNIWMYVIWEMQDMVNDCKENNQKRNDDPSVKAWDEAWAFYAGSLEGTAVGGDAAGKSVYRLAQKRCANYGTCTADSDQDWTKGVAMVNHRIMQLHIDGHMALNQKAGSGGCAAVENIKDQIVAYMTVPLVQGTLRYLYKQGDGDTAPKEAGELWAFAAAILPQVHNCNAEVARRLNQSSYPGTTVKDYRAVKKSLESVYGCLGIKCSDVGGLLKNKLAAEKEYYPGMEPCRDENIAPLQGTVVSPLSPVSQPGNSALTKQVADLQAELAKLRANTVSTSSADPAGQPAVGLGLLAAVVTFVLVR